MNNKATLTIAGLALFLSATCAHADPGCAKMVELKLTVKEYHLDLNDNRPVCVTVPGTFKIKIHNPPGSGVSVGGGDVTAEQKTPADEASVLMNGDNASPVNKLTINVEAVPNKSIGIDDEFEFWIDVEGVGRLDPRIRVVDTETMSNLQWAAVDDTMDSWDLGIEDVDKLRPPPSSE